MKLVPLSLKYSAHKLVTDERTDKQKGCEHYATDQSRLGYA